MAQALAAAPDASLGAIPASAAPQPPLEEALSLAAGCTVIVAMTAGRIYASPPQARRSTPRLPSWYWLESRRRAAAASSASLLTIQTTCSASPPRQTAHSSRLAPQKAFARGGQGRTAPLLVWDAESLAVRAKLAGVHEHAVTSVAFSWDGRRLLSSGMDALHSVALWDWQRGTHLLTAEASPRPLLGLAFLRPRATAAMAAAEPPHPDVSREDVMPNGEGAAAVALPPPKPPPPSGEERIVVCGERELAIRPRGARRQALMAQGRVRLTRGAADPAVRCGQH